MRPQNIATTAIYVHVALVACSVYFVTRIANFTPLSEMPSPDTFAFSATAIPPLITYWLGSWLARGERANKVLGYGLAVGAAIYGVSLIGVMSAGATEPLAPLWLILVSLWLLAGYAVLLIAVWLVGRRTAG